MRVSSGSIILFLGIIAAAGGMAVFGLGAARADHDPGDPDVDILAVDTDSTGNTATHVETIEDCRSVTPGSTFTVDIVVDQIPDFGLGGFGADFLYNPAILQVTGIDDNLLLAASGPANFFRFTGPTPDTDGDFRIDVYDISQNYETGEGVLVRLTLTAVGTGKSVLALDDRVQNHIPDVLNSEGTPYVLHNNLGGTIAVGQACSTSTDLQATAATISPDASAETGTPFNVTAGGTVVNAGPSGPVTADASITLATPPDCTVAGGAVHTSPGLALDVGSPVTLPDQVFSVTCTSPSFHSFTSTTKVTNEDPAITESILGNNQTSASATLAVIAHSDLALSMSLTTSQATPSPMAGMTFQVNGSFNVTNNGPSGPETASGQATIHIPSDCFVYKNPLLFSASAAASQTVSTGVTWQVTCRNPGDHAISADAVISATDIHVVDAPGNNSASASTTPTLKVGACGADPAPAGNILQNLSPQLLLLIQSLTSTGTPVADNLKQQLDCHFGMTFNDKANTPVDDCPVQLLTEAPCSLKLDLSIDLPGGSPAAQPSARLNPVGVTFLPAALDWANDTEVPNGTPSGSGSFGVRVDGGLLQNGVGCALDVDFPLVDGIEGGIQGNVPDSNSSADLTNPNVWPNDLNAERALVESSFAVPIIGTSGVTLWSRTIVLLHESNLQLPLNILTWKVTNPAFQLITGAQWVVVPFPGDAIGPDAPGAIGGNPDADDPPVTAVITYCTPHNVTLQFNGMAGSTVFIACKQTGSHMGWNLVDPDALNVTGDEGPRSDTSTCSLDADNDGLSQAAETYWGTSATNTDSDGDGVPDGTDNCKTLANAGQANYDGDGLGDPCDPDVDGDGVANASDRCPNTAVGAIADTNGCSDAQVDRDQDGFCDPNPPSSGPGPCTGVDNCPNVANQSQADTDGDGYGDACDGCVAVIGHWTVPANDADCDGWPDTVEQYVGTDPGTMCAATPDPRDETADVWPTDLNNDQLVNGQDILSFNRAFGHTTGQPEYQVRNDLNQDGLINGQDVLKFNPFFGKRCV